MKKLQHKHSNLMNRVIDKNQPIFSSHSPYCFNGSTHHVTDHAYLINLFHKLPINEREALIKELCREFPSISIQKFPSEKEENYRLRRFAQLLIKVSSEDLFKKKIHWLYTSILKVSLHYGSFVVSCSSFPLSDGADHDDEESKLEHEDFQVIELPDNNDARRSLEFEVMAYDGDEESELNPELFKVVKGVEFVDLPNAKMSFEYELMEYDNDEESKMKLELFKVKTFELRGGGGGTSGGGGDSVSSSTSDGKN